MLLNNPNTHQFYFVPDAEHNILFRNMNDTQDGYYQKRPYVKIKCYVGTISMLSDVVCGPTMWRQKVNWVKPTPLLDYRNRKPWTSVCLI